MKPTRILRVPWSWDPSLVPARANLGGWLLEHGRIAEAIPRFEAAAQLGATQHASVAAQLRRAASPLAGGSAAG
jgi:hypothetical protein